jgi:hypothetical protein
MNVIEYNEAVKMISKLLSESSLQEHQRSELESNLDAIDNYFSLDFDSKLDE